MCFRPVTLKEELLHAVPVKRPVCSFSKTQPWNLLLHLYCIYSGCFPYTQTPSMPNVRPVRPWMSRQKRIHLVVLQKKFLISGVTSLTQSFTRRSGRSNVELDTSVERRYNISCSWRTHRLHFIKLSVQYRRNKLGSCKMFTSALTYFYLVLSWSI